MGNTGVTFGGCFCLAVSGKFTSVHSYPTLTVVAHDRFNDLIEKAKDADGVIHALMQVKIGEGGDVSTAKPVMIEAPSIIEQMLKQVVHSPEGDVAFEFAPATKPHGVSDNPAPGFTFQKEGEVALAQTALTDILPNIKKQVATIRDLNDDKVMKRIVADATRANRPGSPPAAPDRC